MAENKKQELFDWLDSRAFQPVLKARPDDYSGGKKDKLEHVQDATRRERERYQHYSSAQQLYNVFKDDLSSEEAKEVHADLRDLDLPTLNDCKDEFEKKAQDLGVG